MTGHLAGCLALIGGPLLAASSMASAASSGSVSSVSFIRIAAAFILCCLVALAAALMVRSRLGGVPSLAEFVQGFDKRGGPAVEVIESRRVSMHGDVSLIRWAGTDYLILCGVGGFVLLDQRTSPGQSAGDADRERQNTAG